MSQKIDCQIEKGQHVRWNGLHLINHDNTVAQGVKAPNSAGFSGIDRIQQLNQGGNYNWGIPVFCQQFPIVQLLILVFRLDQIGMMFQDEAVI